MKKPYFIMMYGQDDKSAAPIVDDGGSVIFFETYEEAGAFAGVHPECRSFGYEIFNMNNGEVEDE